MLEWIGLLPLLGVQGNWRGYRMGGKAVGGVMDSDMKGKFEAARASGDMDAAKTIADSAAKYKPEDIQTVAKPVEKEPTGTHEDGLQRGGRTQKDFADQLAKYAKDKGITLADARKRVNAIQGFTNEDYVQIRRSQEKGKDNKKAQYIEDYLRDGTPFNGQIYRGLTFNTPEERASFMKGLESGQMTSKSMSSWSSDLKVAGQFGGDVVLGVRKNKSGVSIQGLSDIKNEAEVLVGKNKSYKVLQIKQAASGQAMVLLEEED